MNSSMPTYSQISNRANLLKISFWGLLSIFLIMIFCSSPAWSTPIGIFDGTQITGIQGLEVDGMTLNVDFITVDKNRDATVTRDNPELSYYNTYLDQDPYFMDNMEGALAAGNAIDSFLGSSIAFRPIFIPYLLNVPPPRFENLNPTFQAVHIWMNAWNTDSRVKPTITIGNQDNELGYGIFNAFGSNEAWFTRFTQPVPEPASIFLFGTGLLGLAAFGRKENNRLEM